MRCAVRYLISTSVQDHRGEDDETGPKVERRREEDDCDDDVGDDRHQIEHSVAVQAAGEVEITRAQRTSLQSYLKSPAILTNQVLTESK